MLEIKHLTKIFDHRKILNDISLTVKRGEIALLLGSSGVGKSTLLRILSNLETYQAGSILLDHKPLFSKQVQKIHPVGMVFQQFNLFDHMSVERNITFALEKALGKSPEKATEIAHALLEKYNLADQATHSIAQLSGGQKQRLAIARSLALKPSIVCLDEPTSALDPRLTNYVASTIQDLAQENYIVLVASHDISLIDRLNCTIYLMDQGLIQETTPSADFLKNKDAYPRIKQFVEGL